MFIKSCLLVLVRFVQCCKVVLGKPSGILLRSRPWKSRKRIICIRDTAINRAAKYQAMTFANRGRKRAMHPNNRYAEKPPDFGILASTYPSFAEYVAYAPNKKPKIDWTDFNATRELTRVLLEHDYGIKWWIPDGQLCPTVSNRANYIHWIEDLLSAAPAPWHVESPAQIKGVDIGTGANCIYPLLGAALNGWNFVATDITSVAIEWAQRNVQNNPHCSERIEVRRANADLGESAISLPPTVQDSDLSRSDGEAQQLGSENEKLLSKPILHETNNDNYVKRLSAEAGDKALSPEIDGSHSEPTQLVTLQDGDQESRGECLVATRDHASEAAEIAPVLVGVIKENENYDFCMCNPPFFEDMKDAGLNPRTACGGTPSEMVYPGGELAFITKIASDSFQLRTKIQWYTSMVGRKVNIKLLTNMLRANGVTMLKTTEFVQGRTSRWGIAWSFSPVQKATTTSSSSGKSNVSFMLEGVGHKCSAWDVLQGLADHLRFYGATVTVDTATFSITGTVGAESGTRNVHNVPGESEQGRTAISATSAQNATKSDRALTFRASVFQQVPGTLLVKASLPKTECPSEKFSLLFEQVQAALKKQFLRSAARG